MHHTPPFGKLAPRLLSILAPLGGSESSATSIDTSGQVVGLSDTTNIPEQHAALWQASSTTLRISWLSSATDLGTLGGFYSVAYGINTSGQVVGYATYNSGEERAALWQAGSTTAIDLGTLGGNESSANSINTGGQVVGYAQTGSGIFHAALWQADSTTAIDLGTLGGSYYGDASSEALSINNSGQVVGYTDTSGYVEHAALWQAGSTTATDLGTLGGSTSYAYGINDSGQVVGYAYTSGNIEHAALWQAGSTTAVDLNSLATLSGGNYFVEARAINHKGQIIAEGSNGIAYLLTSNVTAVPLPAGVWLFGSALAGFIGFNRRKLALLDGLDVRVY